MSTDKIKISDRHAVTVSRGNSKVGVVYSVSMPPVVTCRPDVPCKHDCYACKLCRIYKDTLYSYQGNLAALLAGDVDAIADGIAAVLQRRKVRLFRWNVSGDFDMYGRTWDKYWQLACRVSELCPETSFMAFTKDHAILERRRPANFHLVASVWGSYRPAGAAGIYPEAHFVDPKDPTTPAPAHGMECNGHCDECGLCFYLQPGDAVYFKKH